MDMFIISVTAAAFTLLLLTTCASVKRTLELLHKLNRGISIKRTHLAHAD